MISDSVQSALLQVTDGRGQPDDGRYVEVARFKFVGQRVGLSIIVTLCSGTPLTARVHLLFDTRSNIKNPHPGGTHQPFMGWSRQQLSAKLADVDREVPQRLSRVDKVQNAMSRFAIVPTSATG